MTTNNQGRRFGSKHSISLAVLICAGLSFSTSAASQARVKTFSNLLDKEVPILLKKYMVPGSAVAVIKDGQVVYKKGYGFADVAKQKPITLQTGFNIGSISKTVAAWGVMRLVEQGKVSLDAPVEQYLSRWKLPKTDFDSKGVTVRSLLSHTAGLSLHGYPGWGPQDKLPSVEASLSGTNNGPGDVRIIMEPGTKWKYSGGGYTICQLLIEEITGKNFSDYMRERVLRPLGMKDSDYKMTPAILANSALAYDRWLDETPSPLFTAKAAAGLHTTIDDFSQFALANLNSSKVQTPGRKILKPNTIKQMFEPVVASKGQWGLGYAINALDDGKKTVGHGGANRGWHAVFRVIPATNDGIVVTTNGSNGHNVHRNITCHWVQWVTGVAAKDKCVSTIPITFTLGNTVRNKGVDAAIKQYHKLKKSQGEKHRFNEHQLNNLGYQLLSQKKIDDAIKIFSLNVTEYPNKANPYDSLGEAYMLKGNKVLAIESYNKALELDPKNNNAYQILQKLAKTK